jgi:hypothetical protein
MTGLVSPNPLVASLAGVKVDAIDRDPAGLVQSFLPSGTKMERWTRHKTIITVDHTLRQRGASQVYTIFFRQRQLEDLKKTMEIFRRYIPAMNNIEIYLARLDKGMPAASRVCFEKIA